jgi:alkylation response protein AidB-like acyl-CoA dehydrogenase
MDFGLSEDQELLQRSAAEFLAGECPPSFVREVTRDEEGFPRALYRQMGELGWMGLIVPEAYGGAGLTFLDLALLVEQLGPSSPVRSSPPLCSPRSPSCTPAPARRKRRGCRAWRPAT